MSDKQFKNPGSPEAREQGCTCPVRDNRHGKGAKGWLPKDGSLHFWVDEKCHLHGDLHRDNKLSCCDDCNRINQCHHMKFCGCEYFVNYDHETKTSNCLKCGTKVLFPESAGLIFKRESELK